MQAEYWVFAVHYHPHGPIEEVKVVPVQFERGRTTEGKFVLGNVLPVPRELLAIWINTGQAAVYTAFAARGVPGVGDYVLNKGARVEVEPGAGNFITTEADGRQWNNLSHLPRY